MLNQVPTVAANSDLQELTGANKSFKNDWMCCAAAVWLYE